MTAARAASSNSPKPSPTSPSWTRVRTTWSCSMTTTWRSASRPARPGHAAHGPAGFSRPQRRNRPMSQYRLNLFIQPEHAKRLDELAAKKGVSKSSIVAAALASWLSPDAGDQREPPLPSGWIDCRGRPNAWARPEHPDRNAGAVHPLFLDHQHAGARSPQDAARAQGKARFEQFVEQLVATCCVAAVWRDVVENCTPIRCGWMTQQRWRPPMSELQSVRHECRSADSA